MCRKLSLKSRKLIAAAVLIIFITAAAVSLKALSTDYLVLYDSDTGKTHITVKAEEGMMFSVEFIHSVNQTPLKETAAAVIKIIRTAAAINFLDLSESFRHII